MPTIDYVTGDLNTGETDLELDITAMDVEDESFDVVLCSHVLEHVVDDLAAMSEIRRVLRPGGFAMLVVPYDEARTVTYEDSSIVSPRDREREFGQWDHVRWYAGPDFEDRLRGCGLKVDRVVGVCAPEERAKYALDGPGVRDWRVVATK